MTVIAGRKDVSSRYLQKRLQERSFERPLRSTHLGLDIQWIVVFEIPNELAIDDVVQSFLLALKNPQASMQTYNISDSNAYTYDEVYAIMAAIFGKRPPRYHIPVPLAKISVAPIQFGNALLERENFMWRMGTLNTFGTDRAYSIEKAKNELGYQPKWNLAEGLSQTVVWYKENGSL